MVSLFFTLVCSLFAAFYFIANDVFKIRGDLFVFLRSALLSVALLPFLVFVDWDRPASFYILMAAACLSAGVGDVLLFEGTKKYSAAALSRVIVSRNIIMFILWPLLMSDYRERLFADPGVLYASIALMCLSTWALNRMRRTPIGIAVIKAALLPMLLFIGCDMLLATAVHGRPDAGDAFIGLWIAGVTNTISAGCFLLWHGRKEKIEIFTRRNALIALVNAALFLVMVFTKTMAIAYLENPGYFAAMVGIYAFWIYLLHRFWLKRAETSDPRLGFIVVVCSIALGLLATQIPR